MGKRAVVRDGQVLAVASTVDLDASAGSVVELPPELESLPSRAIMDLYRYVDGAFVKRENVGKPASELRVALVSNWRMRCGISAYAEKLWPHVAGKVGDWRVFAERNSLEPDPRVVECWTRGEPLGALVDELRAWKPDVVWIQHEYGIWPNARHWLSLLSQLSGVRVIVTLHSVYRHLDKLVCEAAIPEIIVHLDGAQRVLEQEKKVPGSVHVVPHGCDQATGEGRLWNIYRSERTFTQFGFGFGYKGWETSIRAAAALKERYPDVFFTGLFSESPFCAAEHNALHTDLVRLVDDLGVRDNVAIIRGYQSEEAIDSYLRTAKAVVFPYVSHPKHEVFGASGAARQAMARPVPVITSSVNHFSDLPTLKADGPDAMAEALSTLFESKAAWRKQVDVQAAYVADNSWEAAAARVIAILEGKSKRPPSGR